MISVFYDLETSDTNTCAQILNCAFVAVDPTYNVVDQLYLEIRLSRLQLPRVSALLANKINILQHQDNASYDERSAMKDVANFLQKLINRHGRINLIGFNSSKFDLKFLRTSMIRNGISPYFAGKLIYKDLLQGVRRLAMSDASFVVPRDEAGKISLRLEAITKEYDLLEGEQAHNSLDDVFLTIKLAEFLLENYGFDICTFSAYEAGSAKVGDLLWHLNLNYEATEFPHGVAKPYLLLDQDNRASLWLDLTKYSQVQDRSAINYINRGTGQLCLGVGEADPEHEELIEQALATFSDLTLSNFFEKSKCDIEQDIYRLDVRLIDVLANAIWSAEVAAVNSSTNLDLKQLLLRARLAEYVWGNQHDDWVKSRFREYCKYRYESGLILRDPWQDNPAELHPSFSELLAEIRTAEIDANESQLDLIKALEFYYQSSEVLTLGLS